MSSTHAQDLLGAREMAEVLPLGAVLAGRVLGDRIAAWIRAAKGWFAPLLAVLAAGCLATLGYGAALASVPAENQTLAGWLVAHGLTDGLATYWQANSTSVDSRGQVRLSAVVQNPSDRLVPYQWETDDANYDPALHYANFVVADGPSALPGMQLSAELTFGHPQRIYHADGYTHPDLEHEPADQAGLTGAELNPARPSITCTRSGAWPPPAARAGRRRRSCRDKASSGSAAAWRPAAPAPSGRAR